MLRGEEERGIDIRSFLTEIVDGKGLLSVCYTIHFENAYLHFAYINSHAHTSLHSVPSLSLSQYSNDYKKEHVMHPCEGCDSRWYVLRENYCVISCLIETALHIPVARTTRES